MLDDLCEANGARRYEPSSCTEREEAQRKPVTEVIAKNWPAEEGGPALARLSRANGKDE